MFFEDGSNPSEEIVRSFIDLAETTIKAGNCVAVHCKVSISIEVPGRR
jgi:cell division cycle 14